MRPATARMRPARAASCSTRTASPRSDSWSAGFPRRALDFGSTLAQPPLAGQSGELALSCLGFDYIASSQVEQPAGAFLMIRRDVWQELGGFDESFIPLWFEDVDFCRRARRSRIPSVLYVPGLWRNIQGRIPSRSMPLEMRRFYWYRSLLRYSAKHFHAAGIHGWCVWL